jgi:putative ABC transport system permease protein
MLVGDVAKYAALVVGLAFGTLLFTQQASIFFGLLLRSTGSLQNIGQPELWVGDRDTFFIGNARRLDSSLVNRVRSVPGVRWAEPLFLARARVTKPDGAFDEVEIYGIDRATLIGRPPEITEGDLADLLRPDAVMVQESSRQALGDPRIGDTLLLNDRRAVVVGFCRAKTGFQADSVLYATLGNAVGFVPLGRDVISYILVGVEEGTDVRSVQGRINEIGAVAAFTPNEFRWKSISWIVRETGIGVNFGMTVALGFIIALVISSAILNQFVSDNQRHFATLKAMGATNAMLIRMILAQALFAGLVGFGLGAGGAGALSFLGRRPGANLDTFFPWYLLAIAFVAMMFVVAVASVLSLWRVLRLQPAEIFD